MAAGTAVVTGAAGGLGRAFAGALAGQGYELVLADRGTKGLDGLADEIRRSYKVEVSTIAGDLTVQADVDALRATIADRNVALLVNNAGFGTFSLFHESDLDRELDMVRVHVEATMSLCRAALPGMVDRRQGAIVNVASAGAFLRFPRDATYIGTKAFLVAFTECLAIELVDTGVVVQALCPGWVRTAFASSGDYARAGYTSPIPDWLVVDPESVVASSLSALGRGSVVHIPGRKTRLATAVLGSRPGRAGLARLRRRRLRLRRTHP